MDTFHPDIQKALAAEGHQRRTDALRDVLLEKARLSAIEKDIAESYFETAAVLYKPERRELPPEVQALARAIDHTYLTITPENRFADVQNVVQLCREAGEWGMASVCVRPTKVALAKHLLDRWGIDDIAVCTVINFPQEKGGRGGILPEKECIEEALQAQRDGATEFDVVIDYEALLRGFPMRAYHSIADVADAVKSGDPGAIVKAILETATLRKHGSQLVFSTACAAAIAGGADELQTSTGYAPEGGATVDDVTILHDEAEPCGVLVEASGGIKTLEQLRALQQAGASRFGMSASVKVLEEALMERTRQ
ncbi:deoxyribose-phosphate aldolase [Candidatus Peregrinibacteria bacterium]|nr:deoxyribose-phosphate aldolase [Candidatus Peregrinibacteria bacterium]MBI4129481.1 deoxyribose-phosphate aldolase [Candidatus Peregrinibacteria bacterium]